MLSNLKLSALLLSLTGFVEAQEIIDPIIFIGNATVFTPSRKTACGFTNIPSNAFVAGLPPTIFDSPTYRDNICGGHISVSYQDQRITAEVVERCADCNGLDLILSSSAFEALTGTTNGKVVVDWQVLGN